MPGPKLLTKREIAKRWTQDLVKDGWTPVSDFFLRNYSRLSPPLTSLEAMLVIHLMFHKWDEKLPFPAFKTLGKRMGISDNAARNHARSLERKKYLRRHMRVGQSNRFDLTPLFVALEKVMAQQRAREEEAQAAS